MWLLWQKVTREWTRIRHTGFTGFYCSYRCLASATGIGYEDFVSDELVEEDKESSGYGWEEE